MKQKIREQEEKSQREEKKKRLVWPAVAVTNRRAKTEKRQRKNE